MPAAGCAGCHRSFAGPATSQAGHDGAKAHKAGPAPPPDRGRRDGGEPGRRQRSQHPRGARLTQLHTRDQGWIAAEQGSRSVGQIEMAKGTAARDGTGRCSRPLASHQQPCGVTRNYREEQLLKTGIRDRQGQFRRGLVATVVGGTVIGRLGRDDQVAALIMPVGSRLPLISPASSLCLSRSSSAWVLSFSGNCPRVASLVARVAVSRCRTARPKSAVVVPGAGDAGLSGAGFAPFTFCFSQRDFLLQLRESRRKQPQRPTQMTTQRFDEFAARVAQERSQPAGTAIRAQTRPSFHSSSAVFQPLLNPILAPVLAPKNDTTGRDGAVFCNINRLAW